MDDCEHERELQLPHATLQIEDALAPDAQSFCQPGLRQAGIRTGLPKEAAKLACVADDHDTIPWFELSHNHICSII